MKTLLHLSLSAALVGCTVRPSGAPPLVLPNASTHHPCAHIAVMSGEMPGEVREIGRHSWIVAYTKDAAGRFRYRRYQWLGGAHAEDDVNPFDYFGHGAVAVHGIIQGDEADIAGKVACLERETSKYHDANCGCWPGPNSNTFADGLIRACGLGIELPATAVGRDYRGPIGVSGTEARTEVQLETWAFGVKVGAMEGISADITGLTLGVHFWPPGIEVPVAPGRIGLDPSTSYERDPTVFDGRRWPTGDPIEHRYGAASIDMHFSLDRIGEPSEARGLADRTTVGLAARGVFGERVGYAFGFDVGIGVGLGAAAGAAYSAHLLPVGVGVVIGDTGFVALTSGIGTSGVSSSVDGAFELPQELRIELDVTRAARLGLYGGVIALPFETDTRRHEAFFGSRVRLGTRASGRWENRTGSAAGAGGFFLGFERRELFETYSLAASFGYELGVGL